MGTEARLARYRDADVWPTAESLAAMLDKQMAAFVAVKCALPALMRAAEAAAERLGQGGRLVYAGAGASGRLAVQDGVELHPTFGWPRDRLHYLVAGGGAALTESVEGAEDDALAGAEAIDALEVAGSDVLIAVAASGRTRYTLAAQERAGVRGALTIAMANNPATPLLDQAEIAILLDTGAEFLAGSTRMTAGTAQKIALNLLSTQTMMLLGHVAEGFMVDVVPSNAKLIASARGIVQALTGRDTEGAAALLEQGGGEIKLAVLLHDGQSLDQARARLAAAGGHLRRARQATVSTPTTVSP